MKRFSFPKEKRLLSNRQFKTVLARGMSARNGLLIVYMAENGCGYPRLGVSVGKSCGNAVVRNRFKRLLREAFRQSQDRIRRDFDYVVMNSPRWLKKSQECEGRGTSRGPTLEQVEASFLSLTTAAVERAGKRDQEDARAPSDCTENGEQRA